MFAKHLAFVVISGAPLSDGAERGEKEGKWIWHISDIYGILYSVHQIEFSSGCPCGFGKVFCDCSEFGPIPRR
jgi:hypothetical protein